MSVIDRVKLARKWALECANALSFLAPAATRLVLGLGFLGTGTGKWQNFENTVTFFTDLGIPFPAANAAFVATLELVGGLFLLAGALTRLMSLGLASTMVVALLTADQQAFLASWTSAEAVPTDITPFTYLLLLCWLIVSGPGWLSLDHLLARFLGVGKQNSPSEPGEARESPSSYARA